MPIVGSGNVVHNPAPRRLETARRRLRLDAPVRRRRCRHHDRRPGRRRPAEEHGDYALAVPTPDHFIRLLYLAGLAADASDTASVLVDGYAMGSLWMVSYALGWHERGAPDGDRGAPALPDVPADETNI
ncbi:MAG: hypothetical protein WKF58_15255 [Ilumatobacteraceae bacterium]